MKIIEIHEAKIKGEDRLVITHDFIAVLDGAGGAEAAACVAGVIPILNKDVTVWDFVAAASSALAPLHARRDGRGPYPVCTQAVVWSRARGQVWRVGDSHFMLDGVAYPGGKLVDTLGNRYRAAIVRAMLRSGRPLEALIAEAPLPQAALIGQQGQYQNRDNGDPLDYGVLDGRTVPPRFVEAHDAAHAHSIVLCSDGFVEPPATLQEGLNRLAHLRRTDPLMVFEVENGRGFPPDRDIFDDTTYVRFEPGA